MTSESPSPRETAAPQPPPQSANRDAVIDEQLRKTQRQVKGVDIAAGLLTLGIGVIVGMFTAITVTRTFMRLIIDLDVVKHHRWFGV